MKLGLLLLTLCICSISSGAVTFFLGLIPNTEPHFVRTYDIKSMKTPARNIGDYSKSSKVKPIGYKFECEKIKVQLNKINREKAMSKIVYGIDGTKKTGKQVLESQLGKTAVGAFVKCDQFL
jgi:hypothetical protein